MKEAAFIFIQILLATVVVSCLVSMMVMFVGGSMGNDFRSLILLQALAAAMALVVSAMAVYSFVATEGTGAGLRSIWAALPQWLVFTFFLVNSLFLFGEISFLIVGRAMGDTIEPAMHVPLLSLLLCSVAFLLLHARRHSFPGSRPAMRGRWGT